MNLNKTHILLIIFILLLVGYIVYPKRPVIEGVTVEQMRDSLKVHDKVRDSIMTTLRIRYMQDSFHIAHIQQQIDKVPEMINSVKRKYNEKRNHIDTISIDDQVGYMSKWLSEEGSNRP